MKAIWITTTPSKPWQRRQATLGVDRLPANLTLTDDRFQKWEGFGGCFNERGWIALQHADADDRRHVLDSLFGPKVDGCRFTLCRLPIGASDYAADWYSHNESKGDLAMRHFSIARDRHHLIPFIREARHRQPHLTLFASPWSPPTWMKFPPVYNYGTLVWEPAILKAYALYFVRFVQAYAAEGIPIHQVHVQNEPVADQKFPSCLWTGAQLRDFIRDYLGPAFRRHGLDTEIWLGTLNTDDYDGFPNTVLSDPKARAFVSGVGFQWAGKGAVQRTREAWPDVRLMQTENECGEGRNSWAHATHVHNLIRHYLDNGACAYVYWNMVLEPGGLSTWGWPQNSMVTVDAASGRVTLQPEYYVMKHYARYILPGAIRVGLHGPVTANATAFRNPDGTTVVVVHNPFAEERDLHLNAAGRRLAARLPPVSFNTFVL